MDVRKFLLDYNIEPRKSWDQLFLQNDSVLEKEIDLADLRGSDTVLEIGAGFGNLTERLAEKARVIAIERDRRFLPYLKNIKNVVVIHGDATKVLKEKRTFLDFNKIVSNIPYSLSKKIILELMKHKWEKAVLVVQKEFADKMSGGSKLSLLIQDCNDFRIIRNIPGNDFYPAALESSLLLLEQRKTMDDRFWLFLNKIFRHKNKDIINVVDNCPKHLARKKVHQLTLKEAMEIYEKTSL